MLITYDTKVGVVLENNLKKRVLISNEPVESTAYNMVLAPELKGTGLLLKVPGEYEVGQISVVAQSSLDSEDIDIVEFIIDDVSVVITYPQFKYQKRVHDNLGSVDILITMDGNVENISELINKFDPEVVVGIKDCKESTLTSAGISKVDTAEKLKYTSEQFGTDEFIVQGVILS